MTNVVSLKKVREHKEADDFATKAIDTVFSMDITYVNDVVSLVLGWADKIVYFSGDVEVGASRDVRECDSDQVLNATKSQRFNLEVMGSNLRFIFDGEYMYDLYMSSHVSNDFFEKMISALNGEISLNWNTHKRHGLEFRIAMLKALL
ncbi:MAG: hypothetical protein ACJAS1_001609 [Oleiphilaceae bacterium]|jgi:hypothetical protein